VVAPSAKPKVTLRQAPGAELHVREGSSRLLFMHVKPGFHAGNSLYLKLWMPVEN